MKKTLILFIVFLFTGIVRAKTVKQKNSLKSLCDSSQDLSPIIKPWLKNNYKIRKLEKFLVNPSCTLDKPKIIRTLNNLEKKGCRVLVDIASRRMDWMNIIIDRYSGLHPCPELKDAVYAVLGRSDTTPEVAKKIIQLITIRKDPTASKYLIQWVNKGPLNVKIAAIEAIKAADIKKLYQPLVDLYQKLSQQKDSPVKLRHAILKTLFKLDMDSTLPLLIAVTTKGTDQDLACKLMARVPKASTTRIALAMKMISDPQQLNNLGSCMMKIGPAATDAVLSLFDVNKPLVRTFVVDFLSRWKTKDAKEFLSGRYASASARDRADIARILAHYGDKDKKVYDIIVASLRDIAPQVRLSALKAVADTNYTKVCPYIVDLAENDRKSEVKKAAIHTAWCIGCYKIQAALQRLIQYDVPMVRIEALKALSLMKESGKLSPLYDLLDAGNSDVAQAAFNALYVLTYKNPKKHKVSSLDNHKIWQPQGKKIVLSGAVAYVKHNEDTLLIVVGGPLDGSAKWFIPAIDEFDDYTVAQVYPDASTTPTEAIVSLLDKVKHKKAYIIGAGIWAIDAVRIQMSLSYKIKGAILINPPEPSNNAVDSIENIATKKLAKPIKKAMDRIVKYSNCLNHKVLSRYYTRVIAPAITPKDHDPHKLWGLTADPVKYMDAKTTLLKQVDKGSLKALKGLVVFSGDYIPRAQKDFYKGLHNVKVKSMDDDCGYIITPWCSDDLEDVVSDYTGD